MADILTVSIAVASVCARVLSFDTVDVTVIKLTIANVRSLVIAVFKFLSRCDLEWHFFAARCGLFSS